MYIYIDIYIYTYPREEVDPPPVRDPLLFLRPPGAEPTGLSRRLEPGSLMLLLLLLLPQEEAS